MKKLTSLRLGSLVRIGCAILFACLIPNYGKAQAFISSGTFQFTTNSYSISPNEGTAPRDPNLLPSLMGARVTVTRSGGSSGRVRVPYSGAASGTLIFDDYQMSASFLVTGAGTVTLGTPTLDPLESGDLLPPALGLPSSETINVLVPGSSPTNSVINFERATFRVNRETATATIHIKRTPNGPPPAVPDVGVNVNYTINPVIDTYFPQTGFAGNPPPGNTYALEAGSDYAVAGLDFFGTNTGTISFAAGQFDQTLTITITNSGLVDFNKDLQIALWIPLGSTQPAQVGGVNQATLTILSDSFTPGLQPAGAVDRTWNKDNSDGFDSNPPYLRFPGTKGGVSDTANGNGGTVSAVVEQTDGKAIIAGSFNSFDSHPYNRIVRLLPNGYQDPTFLVAPNSGANDAINAMALQPDGKIIIGGNFTSFNGANRYHIARLNSDGSLDTTFNPGLGADGMVWAVSVRADGRIVIGGDFTHYNGTECNYVARLNSDGSLDSQFAPGASINGPVYALAQGGASTLNVSSSSTGGTAEDVNFIDLGNANSGSITVNYDMLSVPDDMRIYYGDTNGILIFDTGSVSGTNTITVAFGPTNGFSTNLLTIVMNQGGGNFGTFWSYSASLTTYATSKLNIGGVFGTISGINCGGVARLNDDGSLDTTFATGLGTYNPEFGFTEPVYALALQGDKLLVGGAFDYMELADYNGLVRLNSDGSVDATFNSGSDYNNGTYNPQTGLVDSVYAITLQPDGNILIGGDFTTYNQTRRVGISRLFSDGSLDTRFMDTAYNQFAGLINHYHNPDAIDLNDYPQGNHRNFVSAIAIESNSPNNVIIGGSFLRVGGGSVNHSGTDMSTNSGVFKNGRMDIHPRSNVARLIGGATPGPGNISLMYDNYSADKTAGTLYVSIARTNGSLGIISAKASPQYASPGPGIATTNDLTGSATPTWPTLYSIPLIGSRSWMSAPGTLGPNFIFDSTYGVTPPNPDVYFNILYNTNITGNLNAKIRLSAPDGGSLRLGGEVIPLGAALGSHSLSPLTIIDTNIKPGVFGFSSPTYTVNQGSTATITVTRTNGTDGTVQINYAITNGTAISPTNYTAVTNTLTFGPGVTTRTFTVPTVTGTTTNTDKTVNLRLFSATGGGMIGQTNAVLTIVNNTFTSGHLAFTTPAFTANETAGIAAVTVNRLGGNSGTLDVTAIISGGTAINGVNYIASTNALHWNNNDISVKTISVPVFHDGIFTPDLTVNLRLTNGLANSLSNSKVLGLSSVTNATLNIVNVDFPGTVHFTSGVYSVKKFAGSALIPVIRTGGFAQTVTVNFSTQNGSATSGSNYTATTGQLTFTNGEVAKYFAVPILDDGHPDGLLSLNLVLSNATPGISLGSPSNAVLNIIDTAGVDEPPGSPDTIYSPSAGFNGNVYALGLQANNQLIVGGDFTMANGVPRQRLARLNANGALDAGFLLPSSTMGANAQIRTLAIQRDGRILVGGFFSNFNSVVENRITRLNYDGSLDSTFNVGSGADNPVYAVAQSPVDSKILVGGSFATLNGVTFQGIGRLNSDGTPDLTFNPGGLGTGSTGPSATVFALAVQSDGKIIIGGDFTTFNGVAANHLARLNTDGSLDTTFMLGTAANDSVRAIAIQLDGKILIGGVFTNYNGFALNCIARLNADGSVDSSFTPGVGANDRVFSIALQSDGRIVLGGQFTLCNGVTRNRVTRLNPNGAVDPTINFGSGASDFVAAVVIQQDTIQGYPTNVLDEKIILGGAFIQYNSQPHAHLARIFGGSVSGSGAFEFSAANYQVNENGLNAVITVVRTGGTSGTNANGSGSILVPFSTSDDTARATTNYSSIITNLDFPMGEVQKTILIPVFDDGVITPDLTVNLAVNPLPPAAYGNQPTAVLTILNSDSAISFETETYQVPKNIINGVALINIVRLGSANGAASVVFSTTTNGTAIADTDYTPTNTIVTFNDGQTVQTARIGIINNGLPEDNQTVTMLLSNVVGSSLISPTNATLTIVDTVNAPGKLRFSTNAFFATEGDGTATITITRTNGSAGTISAFYYTVAGTAVPGVNYLTVSNVISFSDGQTSRTFTVPIVDNSVPQAPVSLTLVLATNNSSGTTLLVPTNATLTISDNDVGFKFATQTNAVRENAGFVVVGVLRVGPTNGTSQVQYTTHDGTATAGVNYTTANSTLIFDPGQSAKSILVPLINDPRVTGDLIFTMTLSNPSPGAQVIAPSTNVIVLQDADAGLSFTNSTISVLKTVGSAVITVVCSNPSVEPVVVDTNTVPLSVNYTTVNGTATAGVDYLATSGLLVFTNGIGTNTFTVPILNNGQVTGDRAFSVILTNPTAPGKLIAPSNQVVTIQDGTAGFKFSKTTYSTIKSAGQATINVYRVGLTNSLASVVYTATNGTAIAGVHYTPTNGVLVFTNGVTNQTFSVAITDTSAVQPDETVLLQLFSPSNGLLLSPSAATLTIHDNSGSFVLPSGSALVSESGAGAPNGVIDSNETVTVLFAFRDAGGPDVTNLIATLLATNGVTAPSPISQTYGPLILAGHSVSRPFSFTAQGTNGQQIVATFQLKDNLLNIGTGVFGYILGTRTITFSNTTPIVINDNTAASPYPSSININGLVGSVVKATVTLTNLNHRAPRDIEVLVVAPNQANSLLMTHAGGLNAITNVTIKFDDAAATFLPQSTRINSGTNKPTIYTPVSTFAP